MSKFKRWLYGKFLPSWCREDLMEANQRLTAQVEVQRREIERLNAYLSGMENALRHQRRIVIQPGGDAQ